MRCFAALVVILVDGGAAIWQGVGVNMERDMSIFDRTKYCLSPSHRAKQEAEQKSADAEYERLSAMMEEVHNYKPNVMKATVIISGIDREFTLTAYSKKWIDWGNSLFPPRIETRSALWSMDDIIGRIKAEARDNGTITFDECIVKLAPGSVVEFEYITEEQDGTSD